MISVKIDLHEFYKNEIICKQIACTAERLVILQTFFEHKTS